MQQLNIDSIAFAIKKECNYTIKTIIPIILYSYGMRPYRFYIFNDKATNYRKIHEHTYQLLYMIFMHLQI